MSHITLPVTHPEGQYEVLVGRGLLPRVRQLAGIEGALAVITDEHVGPLYAHVVPDTAVVITVPAGEQHKTLATVNSMYEQLLAAGIDRSGTVLALGGGVVGDMAGFAAATYMRGIRLVQCPTSLLAMVDSSVGGKTGVDLPQGKNLVGAFKQPTAVLADLDAFATLPAVEFANGMAELIKHGLIGDPDLFAQVETADWRLGSVLEKPVEAVQAFVAQAIQVKRDVVQEDPFEQGRRAHLNLGHTFGHAIEQVSGYAVAHGQGVAMGLVAAVHLSARLGLCAPAMQPRLEAVLQRAGLPTRIPAHLPAEAIYRAMFSDKKKAHGRLRFVLLRDVGDVLMVGDVGERDVLETITAVQN
jgi:3-dehydroquinate synthase